MSVINKTTKGKNERIELAATENAKVCASVRIKYLAVESTSPEERLRPEPGRDAGDADLSRPGMGGVGMSRFNPSRVGDLEAPDNSRRIRGLPEGIPAMLAPFLDRR